MGKNNSFFAKYYNERTKNFTWSWSLTGYGELDKKLQSLEGDEPEFVSLGSDGYYFVRTVSGHNFWCLPDDADEYVEARDNDPVTRVWLGVGESFVAQTRAGAQRIDLCGNYGSLQQFIRSSPSIMALGLNLDFDRWYLVMFSDKTVQGNPYGTDITVDVLRDWARRA